MVVAFIPIVLSGPNVTEQDAQSLATQMEMAIRMITSQLGDQKLGIGNITMIQTGDTNGG